MRTATPRAVPSPRVGLLPPQLLAGLLLLAVAWPLAWFGDRPYSDYTFFPLWLSYILVVDGLVVRRSGTSLLTRDARRFVLLFAYSMLLWWVFEAANQFLGNWQYRIPRDYAPFTYGALASLAFSTVMPAMFETAEFLRTFSPFGGAIRGPRFAPSRRGLLLLSALGLAMFALSLVYPKQAFPLVWIGLFLFLDPLTALLGGDSLAARIARGRWDTVVVLFAAGLTCGFFWEMWNYWSMPKWVYDVPYVGGMPKLFEMPLLGYGGYFPFALEVYAVYQVLHRLLFRRPDDYLRFDQPEPANRAEPGAPAATAR